VKERFAEYYRKNLHLIKPPPSHEKREYGFILFRERIMVRHKGFRNQDELSKFIGETVPSDAYHSTAYYNSPHIENMGEKGWIGADLVFDIDADHIKTSCKKAHDSWICRSCGHAGRGEAPKVCPSCSATKLEEETWLCEQCLEKAKDETIKLMDVLTMEFGLSTDKLTINFSGHRGYHVHVRSEDLLELGEEERKEIVDYILGLGLEPELHGFHEGNVRGTKIIVGPKLTDLGWRGRIARGFYETLAKPNFEAIGAGLRGDRMKALAEARENWLQSESWGAFRGVGMKTLRKIVSKVVEERSIAVDTVVTTDTHRLIRLTGTLNGKTGLRVVEVKYGNLEAFDPFVEAVAFRGEETVFVEEAPSFRLGEQIFGPFRKQKIKLPLEAALMLICKKKAYPVAS